ncbi:hypothetical protein C5167_049720 [Papaver somniferum]|uniref:WRKY domain-containing protein n=1 Tax=Papaver somniferum TaxID=3469 RepID=A0A4Y7KPG7_PAPSO|nr:probable WRKY transcription factor 65 [Papaver somniferum]RZC74240.1 hypothetical protein C5167_049720 [Papaver somniferum]
MDGRFNNPFISEEEEAEFMQENCTSSPTLSSSPPPSYSNSSKHMLINDHHHHHIQNNKHHQKALSVNMASPKKSRRAMQKRVVSIPIGEIDGSSTRTNNSKGEGAPPSDSWAWRKYGQKPIKGSPYPRGYYRCSSSKGCPARKQVERSRVDPTMLVITYACEHNHPWPASRNNNSSTNSSSPPPATKAITTRAKSSTTATITTAAVAVAPDDGVDVDTKPKIKQEESAVFGNQQELIEDKFNDLGGEEHSMIINATTDNDFGWFTDDVVSASHGILESPICAGISSSNLSIISGGESGVGHDEMPMIFPMREEDESLFADLGELPECSVVFRRSGFFEQEEERRRCSLRTASWCGSTG